MLTGALKWGALRAADVFVLPSHQENFGITVAEALAVSVPVLISEKVNIWREVRSYGAGLIEPDTLAGTCQLLRSYAEMPKDEVFAMRRRALSCFRKCFEITQAAQNLNAVLTRAVSHN